MKITSTHIVLVTVILILILISVPAILHKLTSGRSSATSTTDLTEFATCLSNSGSKFYGAFWCPHCKEQKELFKNATSSLPYVECSTPDQQGQTQVCIDAQIKGYPTWEFKDGSRVSGVQTLSTLASKTNCPLPNVN